MMPKIKSKAEDYLKVFGLMNELYRSSLADTGAMLSMALEWIKELEADRSEYRAERDRLLNVVKELEGRS